MGTLFTQAPRNYRNVKSGEVSGFLDEVVRLAKTHKMSVSDVIAAMDVLERQRSNDLYVANGDAHDEQLAGFGELLGALTSAVESLGEAVAARSKDAE